MYQYPYGGYTTAPSYVYTSAMPETRDQFIRRWLIEKSHFYGNTQTALDDAKMIWDESIKTETK